MKNVDLQEYLDGRKKFLIILCIENLEDTFLEDLRRKAFGSSDYCYANVLPSSHQSDWIFSGADENLSKDHSEPSDNAVQDTVSTSQTAQEQIPEVLHSLADKLPVKGFQLDVLWFIPSASSVKVEENAALLGALKRLQSWHGAQVTLLQRSDEKSALSHWLYFLSARYAVLSDNNPLSQNNIVWRGKLRLAEGKSNASLSLPGFQLTLPPPVSEVTLQCPHSLRDESGVIFVFDDILDVVDMVSLDEVPRCLLLPDQMQLSVPAEECLPRSFQFLNWLIAERAEERLAIVAQLSYKIYHTTIPACVSAGLGAAEWKEQLADDCLNYTVPEKSLEASSASSEYLLLYRGQSGECCVKQFVSVSELNGAVPARLAVMESLDMFSTDSGDCRSVGNPMECIPHIEESKLWCLVDTMAETQIQALKHLTEQKLKSDPNSALSTQEVKETLTNIRRECFQSLKLEELTTNFPKDCPNTDIPSMQLPTDLPDPSQILERLALINAEVVREKLRREKSKDLQLAGMVVPLPVNDTITLHLNASEFLKHFLPSGLPRGQNFSPIGIASKSRTSTPSKLNSRPQFTEKQLREMEFKESLKHRLPGVHYCIGQEDLKSDAKMARLIQRVVPMETATTCSHNDAVNVIKLRRRRSLSKSPVKKLLTTPRKSRSKLLGKTPRNLKRSRRSATGTTPIKRAKKSKTPSRTGILVSPRKSLRSASPRKPSQGLQVDDVLTSPKRRPLSTPKKDPNGPGGTPRRSSRLVTPRKSESSATNMSKKTPQKRTGGTPRKVQGSQKRISPSKRRTVSLTETSTRRNRKMSRSEKHKKKLMEVVKSSLATKGVDPKHPCYKRCFNRLFDLSKSYVKDLKTSKGLYEEMKQVAEHNVEFVVKFELKSKSTSS